MWLNAIKFNLKYTFVRIAEQLATVATLLCFHVPFCLAKKRESCSTLPLLGPY